MKRLILAVMMVVFLFTGVCHVYAVDNNLKSEDIKIILDGVRINTEILPMWANSRLLVPARPVFSHMGVTVNWHPENGLIELSQGTTDLTMLLGDRNLKINNAYVKMDAAPVLYNGVVLVPLRLVAEALKASVVWDGDSNSAVITSKRTSSSTSRGDEVKRHIVVIDAGHGGNEPGAIYGGIKEKDLNLSIAIELNKLLTAAGVKTYMTRTDDRTVGLYKRSDLANSLKADLLISIHNNADGTSTTKGSMSLYYPLGGNSKGNLTAKAFAGIVQNKLNGKLNTGNLGSIPRPNLAVLRTAKMPAVIAEVGYMTNLGELSRLKTVAFKQEAAEALKDAVLEALSKI